MSQRPKYRGDHYWREGDVDWWEELPEEDLPAVGYIPKKFRGPSFDLDGIDLGKFTKGIVAHVAPNPSRRPNTPLGGRTKTSNYRLPNREFVIEASPNGKNDQLTNDRRLETQKLHMVPFATSTAAGFVIDRHRGQPPGTWFPCGRNNNFFASPNLHSEESKNLWLFFSLLSLHNLNFASGIIELIAHNLANSPKDRVKYTDYFPHLERTSNTNRGYPCLAVCVKSGSGFRIFGRDGKTEIDPGREKLKDNGILFISHLDPDQMTIRTAQVIHYWDWIGTWPKRDKPFNAMINRLIRSVRSGTVGCFQPGVGETLAYYDARIANKNPPSYIDPVTQLTEIAKPTRRSPPSPGPITPPTVLAYKPGVLDLFYYATDPDGITPDQEAMEKRRLKVLKAMEDEAASPPVYESSSDDDSDNAAPTNTATTPAASEPEGDADHMYEFDFGGRSDLDTEEYDEESEVEAMVLVPSSDSDDDGNAAPTQTAPTPAVSNSEPDESEGGVEVEAEISTSIREEDKEGDAPVSPVNARTVRTQSVEEALPVRRSSRIPIRSKKSAPLVESEHNEVDEVKPVRKPRTRSATQKKGTETVAASRNKAGPAEGRRLRTRAATTKAAKAATNNAANVDAAPKRESKRIAAIKGKAVAATSTQSNAMAGPGPSTIAMRRRKRDEDSDSEVSKDEGRKQKKQKKQKQVQQQKPTWRY
ncbi:hypothetical protein CYLTODRAFT_492241 [Cylindrobasidium torrendii FP15055 ss-10]|uniref:Uncharacterized protein n=1 Tax=Cylindrobasidium torrendii FP15055 ss-10 TaxID=1314674 RepID=A0A0D7B4P8_9AGAR|nr:hypothetical protein CYLTODRAFT_492241 [Cylindrobasidium torrendii FP15055 ss-10]